jgi:hypothetical protein
MKIVRPNDELIISDYWRANMYATIRQRLFDNPLSGEGCEFGGSNGVIQSYCPNVRWESRDHPPYDVQSAETWDRMWDVVVMDQILEHVPRPWKAFEHLSRCTRKFAIITVPFSIEIHPCPGDWWRMTPDTIRLLANEFSEIEIGTWGSPIVSYWYSTYRTTEALIDCVPEQRWREVLEQNDPNCPFVIWALLRK